MDRSVLRAGSRISVHNRALPAFQQVANNLAATGSFYSTRAGETFGFTARTVSGSRRSAITPSAPPSTSTRGTNPTAEGLITDMPPWYVDAWRQAGFCWGGDWIGDKDPMHYSWMGPAATPGLRIGPAPLSISRRHGPFQRGPGDPSKRPRRQASRARPTPWPT